MTKSTADNSVYCEAIEAYNVSLSNKSIQRSTNEDDNETSSSRHEKPSAFKRLCGRANSTNKSFCIQNTSRSRHQKPEHYFGGIRTQKAVTSISRKTIDVYKACPSSPSSYRAKKQKSQSIDLEQSRLEIEKNIENFKSQLTKSNELIQQLIVRVPAMPILRNLIRKLYEADHYFMQLAFMKWRHYADDLRQHEKRVRRTANLVKTIAKELVRNTITIGFKQVELEIKGRISASSTTNAESHLERWNRSKSMYNMTSDFEPRGSIFQLPNLAKHKSKLQCDKNA